MIWRRYSSQHWRLGLLLLLWPLLYVGALAASDRWLRGAYLDFTANHLYTLTPGTRQILSSLHQPIELKLYFSRHAAADLPQLRSYHQRVAEMLREFVSRSHGMLRLRLIDPLPYSDDEVNAESDGLTPLNSGSNGEQLFLGLVGQVRHAAHSDIQPQAIPLLDPNREGFLEYDIAKLLYELNTTSRPHIEFVSGLPMAGNPGRGESPWVLLEQLRQLFNITWVDQEAFHEVDKGVKAVFLIQPTALSTAAQYALDQYVLRGGHLVVFVDPDAEMSDTPTGSPLPASSDLPRLLHNWGVRYNPHEVVLDRSLALPIELSDQSRSAHPAMLGLGTAELNHHDMITAGLQRVNLSSAGHFDLTAHTQNRLIPLLQSSADAKLVPAQRVSATENDPSLLLDGYHPDGVHYALAARLRGVLDSAFPEYAQRAGHLARSQGPVEVLLVADTDLFSDRLWL
ncbi:abc transporter, partial [Lasius niger]